MTSRDVNFFRKCLCWSSLKVVSVPTSVIGGLRGSTMTSDLVNFQLFAYFLSNLVEDRRFAALSAFDVNCRSKDKNPVKTISDDHIQEGGPLRRLAISSASVFTARRLVLHASVLNFFLLDIFNRKKLVKDHKASERCLSMWHNTDNCK